MANVSNTDEHIIEIEEETTNNTTHSWPTTTTSTCQFCNTKGVQYYATKKNSWKGKIIRAFIVLLAGVGAVYVALLSSERYFNSWVQTVIEHTDVHVSEISFPAVTICPLRAINRLRMQQAMAKFLGEHEATVSELEFATFLDVIEQTMWTAPQSSLSDIGVAQDKATLLAGQPLETDASAAVNNSTEALFGRLSTDDTQHPFLAVDLANLIMFMSFDCDDIFEECTWRRAKVPCCTLFRKIQTYKGVCYSFNSILVEDPNPSWPWRVSDAGMRTGLKVLIKRTVLGNRLEKIATMVHDPTELLSTDINYLDSERVIVAVHPLRFTADHDLYSLRPELRHCYFTSELRLLGKSKTDCIRDCRMMYIERNCNCSYYLPQAARIGGRLPICRASNLQCIYEHRSALLTTGNIIEERFKEDMSTLDCKCYPNCNFIQYQTSFNSDNTDSSSDRNTHIELQIHYQQDTLFSYRSVLRFTLLDLIVSYGGIAGLFLGLSLVGVIETIHQFIICWKNRGGRNVHDRMDGHNQQCTEKCSEPKYTKSLSSVENK